MIEKTPKIKPLNYRFQFNGDVASCAALACLFSSGWEIANTSPFEVDDGHSWITLVNWQLATAFPAVQPCP